jgi:hypothetical protein
MVFSTIFSKARDPARLGPLAMRVVPLTSRKPISRSSLMIHIGRAGARLGSFSEFEVKQGLASGRFFLTDLGWKEGMENWAPLSQFSEFDAPAPPMPPLPERESTAAPASAGPEGAQPGLPWDQGKQAGFLRAFAQTAWMVLFNPAEAFERMRIEGSLAKPLLYNLIGGWFGVVVSGIYLVLTARMQPPPGSMTGMRAIFYLTPSMAMRELQILVVLGPIVVTVSALLGSAVAHLFLMLVGGANKAYHVTLRVFCFSYGSAQLLQIIPVCGNLLSPVWMLVCCVLGLAAAHGTSTGRTVAAMALFMAAFLACCLGALFLAAGADYQSVHQMLTQ